MTSSVLSIACAPGIEPPRHVLRYVPRAENAQGVFLNEDVLMYFDREIDRASVTSACVRMTARDGTAARGTWTVEGPRLRFQPAPVLAPGLDDGGYRPGTDYAVEVFGFPKLDGLRAADGAPLAGNTRFEFRTVEVDEPRRGLIFDDRDPVRTRPLRLFPSGTGSGDANHEIGSLDSLYLRSDKPLDPSSFEARSFELVPRGGGPRILLSARLIENASEARIRPRPARAHNSGAIENWLREPRASLLELTPPARLSSGLYTLQRRAPESGPSDFSGHNVWDPALSRALIRVRDRGDELGRGLLVESFLDTRLRSPLAVPGADGTAAWSDTGCVEVRFPAAAGDGSAGRVALSESRTDADVAATRIELAAGVTCALSSARGLVVLRAQGRLQIAGRLVRRTNAAGESLKLAQALEAKTDPERRIEPLTAWLERARESGVDCTVLIAGGDLVVDSGGSIEVDTPLLLVAGGVVRVAGTVAGLEESVCILGDGGGLGIDPPASPAARLAIDAPRAGNPLREALHLALFSGPLPPRGEVSNWLVAEALGSSGRRGSWNVRYVREVRGEPRSIVDLAPVDSPRLIEPAGTIQALIELVVEPGGAWSPPFVDELRLTWEHTTRGNAQGEGRR